MMQTADIGEVRLASIEMMWMPKSDAVVLTGSAVSHGAE
jgi:hypothetical protein